MSKLTRAEASRLHTPDLTPAQSRYLREIQEAGERTYNGRARKPLEALRAAGLIEYDFELLPAGAYGQMVERFACRPLSPAAGAFRYPSFAEEDAKMGPPEESIDAWMSDY